MNTAEGARELRTVDRVCEDAVGERVPHDAERAFVRKCFTKDGTDTEEVSV